MVVIFLKVAKSLLWKGGDEQTLRMAKVGYLSTRSFAQHGHFMLARKSGHDNRFLQRAGALSIGLVSAFFTSLPNLDYAPRFFGSRHFHGQV